MSDEDHSCGSTSRCKHFHNSQLKTSSEGVETAEEVRRNQITGLMSRFNRGREFKRLLDSAEFEKLDLPFLTGKPFFNTKDTKVILTLPLRGQHSAKEKR